MSSRSMSIDSKAFRTTLGHFATGIAIAATRDADGKPVGVTVNSFTSVSLEPPLILFCLDRAAKSYRDFTTRGCFAVSVLEEGQQHLSRGFASSPWSLWDHVEQVIERSGAPIIKNSLAWVDCETEAVHRGGDHDILLGRVVALGHSGTGRPLLYWRGRYQRLNGE
jgi:flavin reductase (DIM6/NTAB) family NADH-FMN oxidoreductase RutF